MTKTGSSDAQLLRKYSIDAAIITHPTTVRWATGFISSNALLYIDAGQRILVTDGRYAEAAQRLPDLKVTVARPGQGLAQALAAQVKTKGRCGFQAEYLTVATYNQFAAAFLNTELVPLTGVFKEEIAHKYQSEVASLERAQQVTDAAFGEILEVIKPGITEKELAAELVIRQLRHGADGIHPDFWPLVASGPNSALPHAHPSERKIEKHDVILFDFGCTVDGYCSDMTRTVCVGEPTPQFRKVYDIVLRAQKAALAKIRVGVAACDVDKTARDIIEAAGHGMPYALGHGIGLGVHEWPILSPRYKEALPDKAVVAIEPGTHLPGEFGVRIEDMVQILENGYRNLTTSPKDLIIL